MAEIAAVLVEQTGYTSTLVVNRHYGVVLDILWETMTDDDVGSWVDCATFADKTVVFSGTIGGGTVIFQGSNDQTNVFTCKDHAGDVISITALTNPVGALVAESPRFIRPVTAGGSSNDIDVRVIARLVM